MNLVRSVSSSLQGKRMNCTCFEMVVAHEEYRAAPAVKLLLFHELHLVETCAVLAELFVLMCR